MLKWEYARRHNDSINTLLFSDFVQSLSREYGNCYTFNSNQLPNKTKSFKSIKAGYNLGNSSSFEQHHKITGIILSYRCVTSLSPKSTMFKGLTVKEKPFGCRFAANTIHSRHGVPFRSNDCKRNQSYSSPLRNNAKLGYRGITCSWF